MKINDAEYYVSNSATTSDAQGNITRDLPVVVPTMNPRIDNNIALIGRASQTLPTPATKEVIPYAVCSGAWVKRTPWQVSRTGVNRSTTDDVCNSFSVKYAPSPYIIGSVPTFPPLGLGGILHVAKRRKSASPALGRNTQNFGRCR